MRLKWFMTNGLLIAVTAAWLVPFFCIAQNGTHTVQEPTLNILIMEIAIFVAIIAFAVWNMVKGIRR
ncbi:MAG: hypothetical protein KAT75_04325 [Dehalococcoidia bacterium]|nr:hypothetical protein [Dehalococcoidia bacterium]